MKAVTMNIPVSPARYKVVTERGSGMSQYMLGGGVGACSSPSRNFLVTFGWNVGLGADRNIHKYNHTIVGHV